MFNNGLIIPSKITKHAIPSLYVLATRLKATTTTATTMDSTQPESDEQQQQEEQTQQQQRQQQQQQQQKSGDQSQQLKLMMEKIAQEQFSQGMAQETIEQEQQQQGKAAGGAWDKLGKVLGILGNVAFYGAIGAGAYFGYYTYKYSAKEIQAMVEDSQKQEDISPLQEAWTKVMGIYLERREWAELQMKEYMEPTVDVLLPPIPEPYRRFVNTLVLDLDEVLVYSDWSRAMGWKHFKRPGASELLEALYKSGYEIVIYTDQLNSYADPLLNRLDKEMIHQDRYIGHRLYQSSTVLKGGKRYRDLNRLGRDMNRVLYVTADPNTTEQHENMVLVTPWKMESGDTVLLDLIPFFEMVAQTNVPDLRDIVKSYEGQDIPTAYKQRLKQVQQEPQQQGGIRRRFSFAR